jgi:hypothetical protein
VSRSVGTDLPSSGAGHSLRPLLKPFGESPMLRHVLTLSSSALRQLIRIGGGPRPSAVSPLGYNRLPSRVEWLVHQVGRHVARSEGSLVLAVAPAEQQMVNQLASWRRRSEPRGAWSSARKRPRVGWQRFGSPRRGRPRLTASVLLVRGCRSWVQMRSAGRPLRSGSSGPEPLAPLGKAPGGYCAD